jgi:hypothetical protein
VNGGKKDGGKEMKAKKVGLTMRHRDILECLYKIKRAMSALEVAENVVSVRNSVAGRLCSGLAKRGLIWRKSWTAEHRPCYLITAKGKEAFGQSQGGSGLRREISKVDD